MFKIKNISGYLSIAGLCPGEEKLIKNRTTHINKFVEEGLLSVTEVPCKNSNKENTTVVKESQSSKEKDKTDKKEEVK